MWSEAAERNKQPILSVLGTLIPRRPGLHLLEIGSGTGQHAAFFAAQFPNVTWQTSDRIDNHDAITKQVRAARLPNLLLPLDLDVKQFRFDRSYDFVYTANTAHIMSYDEVTSMFTGVAQVLEPGGQFILYGPVNRDGEFTSESNRQFDTQLRAGVAHRGLRNDRDLDKLALDGGMLRVADYDMPANNRILVWQQPD